MSDDYRLPPSQLTAPDRPVSNPLSDGSRLSQEIACVQRELDKRLSCYPKWVREGKLNKEDGERELAAMRSVLGTLLWLKSLLEAPRKIELPPNYRLPLPPANPQ